MVYLFTLFFSCDIDWNGRAKLTASEDHILLVSEVENHIGYTLWDARVASFNMPTFIHESDDANVKHITTANYASYYHYVVGVQDGNSGDNILRTYYDSNPFDIQEAQLFVQDVTKTAQRHVQILCKFVALSKDNMVATMISLTKKERTHPFRFRCSSEKVSFLLSQSSFSLSVVFLPFILISSRVVECSYSALDMRANKLAITCPATPYHMTGYGHAHQGDGLSKGRKEAPMKDPQRVPMMGRK
jgi:hypothetical protein